VCARALCFLFFFFLGGALLATYIFASNFITVYRCFGCQVLEGYGMTETSCVISSVDQGDNLSGHVGSPNPACGECYILGC